MTVLLTRPPQGLPPARMSGSPIPVRPECRQGTPKTNTCQARERNSDRSTELNTLFVHSTDLEPDRGAS